MTLCIDIGNSFVKCAVMDEDKVVAFERVATGRFGDGEVLGQMLKRVPCVGVGVSAIVSSVVPAVTDAVARAAEKFTGAGPMLVSHNMKFPFDLAVASPEVVGTDRLCAAAGAMRKRRQNAIVVDVGSAITVDVVDRGKYRGGLILTGPKLSLSALGRGATKLPEIDFDTIPDPLPTFFDHTEDAMMIGAVIGSAGAIREAVQYLSARCGRHPRRIVTGGQAAGLSSFLPAAWEYDRDLVLKGLARIAALNGTPVSGPE